MNRGHKKTFLRSLDSARNFLISAAFVKGLIILVGSLALMLIFFAALTPMRYQLAVGMVPTHTIAASRDVVDELATEQNRQQAAAVLPTYKFDPAVTEAVLNSLEAVRAELNAVRQYALTLPEHSPTRKYTAEETSYADSMISKVDFRDYQLATLMNASQADFDQMYASLEAAARNTLQSNVTQGQENTAITSIMQIIGFQTDISLLQNVVLPVLEATIRPNMIVDQAATDAARQAASKAVEPVIYKQGQNIVVRGEGRISANDIALLDSLGVLSSHQVDYYLYLGGMLFVSLTILGMLLALRIAAPGVFLRKRTLIIIFSVLVLVAALSFLTKATQFIYAAPVILAAMLLTILIGYIPAVICNATASLLIAFMLGNGGLTIDMLNIFACSLIGGTAAAFVLHRRMQRAATLIAGAVACGIFFLTIIAIGLMASVDKTGSLYKAGLSLIGAVVATFLCLALQPGFESLFNLATANRLLELSNPNHPLLRRLLMEAPGTYHHSVVLANLAEAAAEAIGANGLLARVGAYYHDIGKLKRPLYFKENQIGTENVHDTTDPQVSAAIITAHVRDGVALGRHYRLPYEILQIIEEHHGNSIVSYFYSKALRESTRSNIVDDVEFRYDSQTPQTAECAIIMLCDTIEAAVRSLSAPTPDEIRDFIDNLMKSKVEDGQLSRAPLTMYDLEKIKATCATVIYGVFHERIEYPTRERKAANHVFATLTKALSQQRTARQTAPAARNPLEKPD